MKIDYKIGDWVETCDWYPAIVQKIDRDNDSVELFYPSKAFDNEANSNKTYRGGSLCSIENCGVHKITPEYASMLMSLSLEKLKDLWETSNTIEEYKNKVREEYEKGLNQNNLT